MRAVCGTRQTPPPPRHVIDMERCQRCKRAYRQQTAHAADSVCLRPRAGVPQQSRLSPPPSPPRHVRSSCRVRCPTVHRHAVRLPMLRHAATARHSACHERRHLQTCHAPYGSAIATLLRDSQMCCRPLLPKSSFRTRQPYALSYATYDMKR